jgi:hypothetical protein
LLIIDARVWFQYDIHAFSDVITGTIEQVSKFQSEVEIELKDSNMGVVRNAIYKAIVQKDVQSKMDTISELIFYTKQQGLIMDDLAASFEILKDTAKRLAATASAIKLSKIKEIQSHESSVTRNIMARLKVLQNSGWYRNSSSSYEMAYVAIQIDASSIKDMLTQCEDVAVMDHFFDHNSTAEVSRALEAEEACLLLYRKLWAIRHTFAGWSNATLECPSLCSPEPLDGMISKANAIVRQQHSLASSEVAKHTLEALDRARRARDCLSLLQPKVQSHFRHPTLCCTTSHPFVMMCVLLHACMHACARISPSPDQRSCSHLTSARALI